MKKIKTKIAFIVVSYCLWKAIKKLVSRTDDTDIKEEIGEVYAG